MISKRIFKAFLTLLVGSILTSVAAQAGTLGVFNPGSPGDFDPEDWTSSEVPGSFFNLTSSSDLEITGFAAYSRAAASGDPGDPFTFQIWVKTGSYVGSEEAAGDWTLLDTINGTDTDDATMEDLVLSQPYLLNSGETMGFAIFATIGGYQWYDTCGGSDTYSEGPLTLDIIDIRGADDGFNSSDNCRSFAGMVNYGVVAVATPTPTIPSLSVTGMILMTLMLGLFGLYRARKTI
jgi:hypothetical protein